MEVREDPAQKAELSRVGWEFNFSAFISAIILPLDFRKKLFWKHQLHCLDPQVKI